MANKKKHTADDYAIFLKHRFFKNVDAAALKPIFDQCVVRHLAAKEVILSPGEANQHLYFLLEGELAIFLDEIDSLNYFTVEAGDCIGEMSIIEERKASAYVVAREAGRVLMIHEALFWEEMATLPHVMRNMLTLLSRRMRKQNKITRKIFEKQLRYELLEKEVEAAGKLQANIVPQETPLFPDYPQVDCSAVMMSARDVGGDFYDAFVVNVNHICIAIGDVSGKGLPAALFMVRAITLLRMALRKKKRFNTVMQTINRMLIKNNQDGNFVTMFVGLLNVKNGKFQYFNGGHNPPLISQNGKPFQLLDMPRGALLGFSNQVKYEKAEMRLGKRDTILLYTDGITEAENEAQDFFTIERALEIANGTDSKASVSHLIEEMQTAVEAYTEKTDQSDDMTMLALRYLKK